MKAFLSVSVVITLCRCHIFIPCQFWGKYIALFFFKKPQTCHCRYNILYNHYLSWPCIHHGWGENSNNGWVWIQDALLQNCSVLLHSPRQRHIIVLGPTSQRVEQQDRPTVASFDETLVGVLHQECMAVMDRVAELEGKYGIWMERKENRGLL